MIPPSMAERGITQQVSDKDVANSRLRIPITGGTKGILPREPGDIDVVLNGRPLGRVWYNPRFGPDRERSGVISIPRAVLSETVGVGDRLPVVTDKQGVVYIGERGSKLRIAQWVNDRQDDLNAKLKGESATLRDFLEARDPRWRSPLRADGYREFSDDLWTRLRVTTADPFSAGFWPRGGPHWDGVAIIRGPNGRRGVLLVEAKSHTGELRSRCTAESETSRETIRRSLDATKQYLGVDQTRDWMESYYQAANRLAFLYYLRARVNVPAWLISIYFVGDAFEVAGTPQDCPRDKVGWHSALEAMHDSLGLTASHPLSHFQHDLFLEAS